MLRSHRVVYDSIRYGYRFKNYTMLERVGEGGEADIWSAWDLSTDRVVAIRIIPKPDIQTGDDLLVPNDVQRQVELLRTINHPNVLPHYEFGSEEHFYYIVMHYCSAGSLADRILAGPISLEDVLKYTAQITSALDYLHNRKIVHRDLNPSNLLLDGQGRLYLADFGLAKLFVQDTLPMHTGRGTEIYAPYEQFARFEVVPQSDIYSLGITVFEMLTGRLPWGDSGIIASEPGEKNLVLPDLRTYNSEMPAELTDVLQFMTAYYWDQRPSSAKEAYQLLQEASQLEATEELRKYQHLEIQDEDTLIRHDAFYLLERLLALFDPNTEKFPARITHFALIDSSCYPEKKHPLTLNRELQHFMLRGSIAHNYHVDEWWRRVPTTDDRTLVCSQIIINEEEATVGRAITQLLSDKEDIVLPAMLRPVVLERLVEIVSTSMSWSLRNKALEALKRMIPKAEQWQQIGITTQSDYKLANVALTDSSISDGAAQLVGWMRSETALQVILESYSTGDSERALGILREILDNAGSLPNIVPSGIRVQLIARQARSKWLQDQRSISISNLLIGLSVGLVITLLMGFGVFSQIDVRMRDSMFEPFPVSNVITIVEIGDEDLEYYGRWDSWPRSLHAELIDKLSSAGARAILLDFLFEATTADDEQLAESMRNAGNVVQPILGVEDPEIEGDLPRYPYFLQANETLIRESALVGHTNIVHDDDGYVRNAPTIIQAGGERFVSLAMAVIQVFLGIDEEPIWLIDEHVLEFAGRTIPVDNSGVMIINYAGPPAHSDYHTYQTVNYRSVLDGSVPAELLKDKIILVGITATGGKDIYLTPVSGGRPMAGIEILANYVETLWSGRFISRPSIGLRILLLLVLGGLIGIISRQLLPGLILTFFAAFLYFILASWLFDFGGIMLDLLYPFLVMIFSFILVSIYRLSTR